MWIWKMCCPRVVRRSPRFIIFVREEGGVEGVKYCKLGGVGSQTRIKLVEHKVEVMRENCNPCEPSNRD